MEELKIGIVGIGIIGKKHIENFVKKEVTGARITAVCDKNPDHRAWACDKLRNVSMYDDFDTMLSSDIDAVLIATPHYFHPEMVISALQQDKHVLVEKPVGVYAKNVKAMNQYAQKSNKVFSIVFSQRVSPIYQEVKKYIDEKRLGTIHRILYTATDWYRTQAYYDHGGEHTGARAAVC
jgi:predicted dehydrogenase